VVFVYLVGLALLFLVVVCLTSIAKSLREISDALAGEEYEPGGPHPDDGERLPGEDERSWPRAA
jgi:hypothetical protein